MKDIILASCSPRRKQLFEELNFSFKTMPSFFKEPEFAKIKMTPTQYAVDNAFKKAQEVSHKVSDAFVIGMDTIAEYKGRVLEKPKDRQHARDMIKYLRGTQHEVITGICIIDADSGHKVTAAETTKVTFTQMSDNEVEKYLDLGAWQDVAAGYAIQGVGALFVEKIEGDYFNVVGCPIFRLSHLMKEIGIPLLERIKK